MKSTSTALRYLLFLTFFVVSSLHLFAQKPTPNFSASPLIGCAPLRVYFNDQSSNDVIDWEWDFNNDGVVDVTGDPLPYFTYTTPGTYSVKLTVFNFFDSSSVVKTKYVTVTAPISISVSPAAACLNDSVQLKATISGGLKPYTYFWSCSTYPNISTSESPTVFVDTTTSWTLEIEDSLQCTGSFSFTLNALVSPQKPSIIHNLSTLSSTVTEAHYQWFLNGIAINGATSKSYVLDTITIKTGYVQVKVTNSNGCSATSDSLDVQTLTSVTLDQSDPGWTLYPNPTSGNFYISYPFSSTSIISGEVFSALGSELRTAQNDERSGRLVLSLEGLNPGVYIVRVRTTNAVHSFRVLKN